MVNPILNILGTRRGLGDERRPWSASTLKEIEDCPSRFVLKRGTYPEIWSRKGFPSRITSSQIKGIVIHKVVSNIMNYVQSSEESPEISVSLYLRTHGGYLDILNITLEKELDSISSNPRARALLESIRSEVKSDLSEMRSQVQFFVKESIFKSTGSTNLNRSQGARVGIQDRSSLRRINSEFKIFNEEFNVEGYLDLLIIDDPVDHIIDYKSAKSVRDEYWDQLKLYGWLWSKDERNQKESNCNLVLVTGNGSSQSLLFEPDEHNKFEKRLIERLAKAESSLASSVVEARPSAENCKFCPVKAICGDYWSLLETSSSDEKWVDLRVKTLATVGGDSWRVLLKSNEKEAILVFGDKNDGSIEPDQEFRILNAFMKMDEELGPIIRLGQNSEIFRFVSD